tara:strand:- start:509 stop:655 length:147 start_codon:yes stop_codon:yes gene_type:complete
MVATVPLLMMVALMMVALMMVALTLAVSVQRALLRTVQVTVTAVLSHG